MICFRSFRIAVIVLMTWAGCPAAMAAGEVASTRERIKTEAARIYHGVDDSSATETEMLRSLYRLREVVSLLGIPDDLGVRKVNPLFCEPRSTIHSVLTRFDDGFVFGREVTHILCEELREKATRQLVCGPTGSVHGRVQRIEDGREFGVEVLLKSCTAAVLKSVGNLVCAPVSSVHSRIYRIDTGAPVGSELLTDDCFQRIRKMPGDQIERR